MGLIKRLGSSWWVTTMLGTGKLAREESFRGDKEPLFLAKRPFLGNILNGNTSSLSILIE
jgi:hypothetical protein